MGLTSYDLGTIGHPLVRALGNIISQVTRYLAIVPTDGMIDDTIPIVPDGSIQICVFIFDDQRLGFPFTFSDSASILAGFPNDELFRFHPQSWVAHLECYRSLFGHELQICLGP